MIHHIMTCHFALVRRVEEAVGNKKMFSIILRKHKEKIRGVVTNHE